MRLQTRILLLLLPSLVLPMVALGWTGYSFLRDITERDHRRQMAASLDQIALNLRTHVQTAEANLDLVSESGLLRRYLLTEDESERYGVLQAPLLSLFSSYQKAYPEYYEIRLLRPDGFEDARATRFPLFNATEREGGGEFFRQMARQPEGRFTGFIDNPDNGEPALLVGKAVKVPLAEADTLEAAPSLRGYLVLTISLDFLRAQSQGQLVGTGGSILFADQHGHRLFAGEEDGQLPVLPQFQEMVTGLSQSEILRLKLGGEPCLLDGRELMPGLFGFASLPEAEILARGRHLGLLVGVVTTSSICLLAGIIMRVLSRLVIERIHKLGEVAVEIGSGNLQVEVPVDRRDEISELAVSFEEMRKSLLQSGERIHHLAFHDSVTGLPNRRLFLEQLQLAIQEAREQQEALALLFLDLDDFKRVNDTLGHDAGDLFLGELSRRIQEGLRQGDLVACSRTGDSDPTLARFGGDEFMVLLTGIQDVRGAARVAARLLAVLADPVRLKNHEFAVGASIGITTYPADGRDAETLIRKADIAMYQAKRQGKNTYQFYTEAMNQFVVERMNLENDLRKALDDDQFTLVFQPQVDTTTGRITGVEALLRWKHPTRGLLSPDTFISIAEETGLIIPIGDWVLHQACRQARAWQRAGYRRTTVAVNISNVQLNRGGLYDSVRRALEESGLSARNLDIELTESSIMNAHPGVLESLRAIRGLGVRISMDDFGTGYSSLGALRHLPVDCLKIDRAFVNNITKDPDDAAIISVIIAMTKILKLDVVAEGVETEEQVRFLREEGCQTVQGYLYCQPVSAKELEPLLTRPRILVA